MDVLRLFEDNFKESFPMCISLKTHKEVRLRYRNNPTVVKLPSRLIMVALVETTSSASG